MAENNRVYTIQKVIQYTLTVAVIAIPLGTSLPLSHREQYLCLHLRGFVMMPDGAFQSCNALCPCSWDTGKLTLFQCIRAIPVTQCITSLRERSKAMPVPVELMIGRCFGLLDVQFY